MTIEPTSSSVPVVVTRLTAKVALNSPSIAPAAFWALCGALENTQLFSLGRPLSNRVLIEVSPRRSICLNSVRVYLVFIEVLAPSIVQTNTIPPSSAV